MSFRLALLAAAFVLAATTVAFGQTNVIFIVDASGSMKKAVGGESRMDAAKRVLGQTLREMPKEARLGLMVYGHRRAKDCKDIELLSPVGADDAGKIAAQIAALQPKGETPIAAALEQAARSFTAFKGQSNSIVLVTDGIEECNGDPCAAAKAIKVAGLDLKVNIVGFTLNDKERAAIECVAKETGGVYYDAKDAKALTAALGQVRQQIAQAPAAAPAAPPPEEFNLLAAKNGGQVLAAPEASWSEVLSGKENDWVGVYPGNEGVFAFKDEGAAKFDKFAMLIPNAGAWVKDFELLAADELAGPYRSLGQFSTQNLRMLKTPYQEFKFAETTARYLKIKVISGHARTTGGWHLLTQVRLVGKLEPAPQGAQRAASGATNQVNLLAAANGGQVLAAPEASWSEVLSGKENDWVGVYPGNEGVFAFKDEGPAKFDKFSILIPNAGAWVKDFELLAADELAGPYRSLGQFSTQNLRMLKTPYQEFKFAETTARYLKIKVISGHARTTGGWHLLPQVQLVGKLEPAPQGAQRTASGATNQVNLLAAANGGQILAAPEPTWSGVLSGKEDEWVGAVPGNEVIFAFKGERAATFEMFGLLIPKDGPWVKEFELLVADEVGGPYRSLGTFTSQNLRLIQTPYQPFKFAPVTAKYLKLKVISGHARTTGGWHLLTQVQLMGKIE